MQYDTGTGAYVLEVPSEFIVNTANGSYKILPVEKLSGMDNLYDFVTSVEDYDYVIKNYVKTSDVQPKPILTLLLLYYDEILKLHAALPLNISVTTLDDAQANNNVSSRANMF
ncbi:hypothetical protein C8E01_102333 [Pontibacter virosus]|uniref:Uncharacterized protein n=2 Tax=Pontibacter virosus TaxID=1765052 RepID=A0A2U1B389_9BACT|nr:hypothetical protein C8E01_102333 [Pontibacter virosus]